MRSRFLLYGAVLLLWGLPSCKKDAGSSAGLYLTEFNIKGEFIDAQIDNTSNSILVVIPHTLKMQNLEVSFDVSQATNASYNGLPVSNGGTISPSSIGSFTIASEGRSRTYTLQVENDLQFFGLGTIATAEKSLNKSYDYYFDQMDGSPYQKVNCGPTASTIAMKWADSTFSETPEFARNFYFENGGWWSVTDIHNYLAHFSIDNQTVPFTAPVVVSTVQNTINQGDILILCLDMYYVTPNYDQTAHLDKFYYTFSPGWGHFIVIKGYKVVDDKMYFEAYDPNSDNQNYSDGLGPKGMNRYYLSTDIITATANWWPHAIVVAPKGQKAVGTPDQPGGYDASATGQ